MSGAERKKEKQESEADMGAGRGGREMEGEMSCPLAALSLMKQIWP